MGWYLEIASRLTPSGSELRSCCMCVAMDTLGVVSYELAVELQLLALGC